jgi:hypothetical protein
MPSVGLKQKLGVAVLTAALFVLSASAASAKEAWVWACHGPTSGSIGTEMTTKGENGATAVANCAGADNQGATLSLGDAAAAHAKATLSIQLPSGVTASRLKFTHSVTGSSTGARYTVTLDGAGVVVDQKLDAPVATLPAEKAVNGSGTLTFTLTCDQADPCGGPVSVDVVKVGALVDDQRAPYGSVGRNSPVNKATDLVANALEEGVGFSRVEAMISYAASPETVLRSKSKDIGSCHDLSPDDATIDLPLDPSRCKTGPGEAAFLSTKDQFGNVTDVADALDSSGLEPGIYFRRVIVYDAAGNATDLLQSPTGVWEPFEVWHPSLGSATQQLSIGSSSVDAPPPPPTTNPSQQPPPKSTSTATSCRSPRLSVSLGQKPLRVSKSVAVLQYGKRYRFEGRLTCVVNNRRVSAPKRTRIELLNKVGKKTVTKTGPRVANKGRFKISLKYPKGSRSLIFRFTSAEGQRSQVTIKIKVEKKKKKKSSSKR